MCGIAGVAGPKDARSRVDAMVHALGHRGPDDNGLVALEHARGSVTLGSARLAIVDLSFAGHMPMRDPRTGNWIVHNGEVYNYLSLRKELELLGDTFVSNTDTEVILSAYGRWGPSSVERLEGMFAFAVWDAQANELFLARDRVGKKPLYFARNTSVGFAFASEVRAFTAARLVPHRLDLAAVDDYLANGHAVAPRTLIAGVEAMLPAHWMRVDADGHVLEVARYWRPRILGDDPGRTIPGLVSDARERLESAITMRLMSDVPLGAFLSGGLDSSAIVAIAARHQADLRTFAVTFEDPSYDESPYSRLVASHLRTTHTEVRIDERALLAWLPAAIQSMDQPTFDGVNTYFVARAAKEHGLTVALSGIGGDEIFGGYRFLTVAKRLVPTARVLLRASSRATNLLWGKLKTRTQAVVGPLKLLDLVDGARPRTDRLAAILGAYQVVMEQFPSWSRRRLLPDGESASHGSWLGLPPQYVTFLLDELDDEPTDAVLARIAFRLFLGERCLRDADTMSMAVSLELRAPFTDRAFMESAWAIPSRIRCAGPDKPFERSLVADALGEWFPRRAKQGFEIPFSRWLREDGYLAADLRSTLEDARLVGDVGLDRRAVRHVLRAFGGRRSLPWPRPWLLYVLVKWCAVNGIAA